MAFKFDIGTKSGKTYKFEGEAQGLIDKSIKDIIKGEEVSADFAGYEFEITGASDNSGFPALASAPGVSKQTALLSYETGMRQRPKREGKRPRTNKNPKGLRLRKTIVGKQISENIAQINMKVIKEGSKKLEEIFPPKA